MFPSKVGNIYKDWADSDPLPSAGNLKLYFISGSLQIERGDERAMKTSIWEERGGSMTPQWSSRWFLGYLLTTLHTQPDLVRDGSWIGTVLQHQLKYINYLYKIPL